MTRAPHLLAFLLMIVPLAACAAGAPAASPAPAAPREGRFTWETHDGPDGARRYRLYVPSTHDGARAAPLLVMLHGCTQSPDDLAAGTRMNRLAEEHGFLVAYPEQTEQRHPQRCWTWFDPAHQARGGGEPALIAGITREVAARHRVDLARVYVAGISAGGAMALNVAAAYPDLYAAAAAHSGVAYRAAADVPQALRVMQRGAPEADALTRALLAASGKRTRPVPLIVFHGGADRVVSPVNAEQTVHQWAAASEEAGAPLRIGEQDFGDGTDFHPVRVRFVDGSGRVVIESWIVPGLGHAWSGGSPGGTYTDPRGPDASREIVRFLLSHSR